MKYAFGVAGVLALALAFVLPAAAQNYVQTVVVTIPGLPSSVEEFVALSGRLTGEATDDSAFEVSAHRAEGHAPNAAFGGAVAFITAAMVYAENEELGMQMLTIAIHPSERQSLSRPGNYNGFMPRMVDQQRMRTQWRGGRAHVPRSYVLGTTPANGYTLPSGPLRFRLYRQASDALRDGRVKLFVACSGADSNRPITLLSDDRGRFKAKSWGSLQSGVRPPVVEADPASDF